MKWNDLIAGPTYVLFVPELAKFRRLVTLGMFQVFQSAMTWHYFRIAYYSKICL